MAVTEFSRIEPLITSKKVLAGSVAVTFCCPDSARAVRAQARLGKVDPERESIWTSLQRSTMVAFAEALQSAAADGGRVDFRREDIQAAIVAAFESVQSSFIWDDLEERWRDASAEVSSFQARLRDMPVTDANDQAILVRTLLELSKSDGIVSTEELLFMAEFVSPSFGSMEELLRMGPLTRAELTSTTREARPTIVMLAWACALCDQSLDPAEVARIEEIGADLGLSATECGQLRVDAQQFLLRQAVAAAYVEGERDDEAFEEVTFAAERMGVGAEETDALERVFRCELGLDSPQ